MSQTITFEKSLRNGYVAIGNEHIFKLTHTHTHMHTHTHARAIANDIATIHDFVLMSFLFCEANHYLVLFAFLYEFNDVIDDNID